MADQTSTPILLIKTKSKPKDLYEERFSSSVSTKYDPAFVACLSHQILSEATSYINKLITDGCFIPDSDQHPESQRNKYGGIIFTSQRAVEAFELVVKDLTSKSQLDNIVLYVVGPATSRALQAMNLKCRILGEECGNGEALAAFMLEDFGARYQNKQKPGLLFLVGEQRRDIIPRTLQDESLPAEKLVKVQEIEVYKTIEHPELGGNFAKEWERHGGSEKAQWVVIFSPSGCKTILQKLGLLDDLDRTLDAKLRARVLTKIVTIGPTTRDYLINEFGFVPDAVAEKPSPEGVQEAIERYNASHSASEPPI
jgi:uroporphyrinogen-III synthase